jgi:hypothetical protein
MNLEGARVELMKCQSGKETIQKLWELDKTMHLHVIVLLWRWWSARNKVNDGGRMQSEAEIQSSVTFFLMEFEKLNADGKKIHPMITRSWKPPPDGFYKINTDGSYNLHSRSGGWGFVIRDTNGDVCWAGAGNITRAAFALQAKAIAAFKAIQQAVHLGMTHIILEMDASVLASTLTSTRFDRSVVGCLVRKI